MKPLFEYCFERTDDLLLDQLSKPHHQSIESETNPNFIQTNIKIDWIRDRTFIYDQLLELHSDRFKLLANRFFLWKHKDFVLNCALHFKGLFAHFVNQFEYNKDRQVIMAAINENGLDLEFASDELKNDFQIVKMAVHQNGEALRYASHELRNNKEIAMIAIRNSHFSLDYTTGELQNDVKFVKRAVQESPLCLEYASDELKKNKEIALIALESEPTMFDHLHTKLQHDRDVIIKTCSRMPIYLYKASKKLNTDLEFLLMMANLDGVATLKYASDEMRTDKEIVLVAVQQNPLALKYASDELKNDRELVRMAVIKDGASLEYASSALKDDLEIAKLALQSSPDAYQSISQRLRADNWEFFLELIGKRGFKRIPLEFLSFREILLESIKIYPRNYDSELYQLTDREFTLQAVKANGLVLEYIFQLEFLSDREITLEAVRQNGKAVIYAYPIFFTDAEILLNFEEDPDDNQIEWLFKYISSTLTEDRSFILQLVRRSGLFFEFFPRKYQIDREIVMEALKKAPDIAFTFTSCKLRTTDRVFAMRIVKKNGLLLVEMSSKHRNDREIVSLAIQQNKKAFKYASEELQNDKELLTILYNP